MLRPCHPTDPLPRAREQRALLRGTEATPEATGTVEAADELANRTQPLAATCWVQRHGGWNTHSVPPLQQSRA